MYWLMWTLSFTSPFTQEPFEVLFMSTQINGQLAPMHNACIVAGVGVFGNHMCGDLCETQSPAGLLALCIS